MTRTAIKYQCLLIGLLFGYLVSFSQTNPNPFEILSPALLGDTSTVVSKLETSETVTPDLEISPPTLVVDSSNPFELLTNSIPVIKEQADIIPAPATAAIFKPTPKKTLNSGPLFGTILGLSVLLAFLFAAFRSSFTKAYQNIINANILKQSYREMSTVGQMPLNLWYLFSWISVGVFVFLIMQHYDIRFSEGYFANLFSSIGIVSGLFLLKHLVLWFIASIFPVRKEVQLYNFLIIIFGVALGVLLVPVNIAIAYLPSDLIRYAVYISLGLVGIFYLLRAFRALLVSNRLLSFHRFHFLLYICAIEIAPFIVLLKFSLLYAGK